LIDYFTKYFGSTVYPLAFDQFTHLILRWMGIGRIEDHNRQNTSFTESLNKEAVLRCRYGFKPRLGAR